MSERSISSLDDSCCFFTSDDDDGACGCGDAGAAADSSDELRTIGIKPLSKFGIKLLMSNFVVALSAAAATNSNESVSSERLIEDVALLFALANDALITFAFASAGFGAFASLAFGLGGVTTNHPLCVLCVFSKLILGMNGASN